MTDIQTAKELLSWIPAARTSYQEWCDVGMALHEEGLPVSLWDDWSRNDSRYHPGECEKKWRTFGNGSNKVTMGTVYHMAEQYGWQKPKGKTFDWDDLITYDGGPVDTAGWHQEDTIQQLPPKPGEDYNPRKDITDYLTLLFDANENVSYVNTSYEDDDGKLKPVGGANSRTCQQLLDAIKKHEDLSDVFGTMNPAAGMWVCFNPMDGTGRSNKNVTSYRYALVESDTNDIDTQYALIQDLKLPVKVLVHSGSKSLHAIVSIDAVDYKQYQERVDFLYTVCRKNGLDVDTQDKNPSRLSRMPGIRRGEAWQYIVAKDIGLHDWVEWEHYIKDEAVDPLPVVNLAHIWNEMPPLKPELIEGILRQGHKMMLVSSSKAGKTFALVELAIAIAEGHRWLGFRCKQGKVLYLNMELDEASFDNRMAKVYEVLDVQRPHRENIDIVHLRGRIESMDKLIPQILRTLKGGSYVAVIIDPIYKMGIGDENAAEQVAKFCNAIDRLTDTGASVIYAHHHSKGAQGQKASMDRASGSGVFARDADALLDMIELRIPEEKAEDIKAEFGANVTAWRLDATLREFPRIEPINLFFSYPLHDVDIAGDLDDANLEESERSMENGRELGRLSQKVRKKENIDKLAEAIQRDVDFSGKQKTQKEYAEEFGVSVRTIRSWLKELGE